MNADEDDTADRDPNKLIMQKQLSENLMEQKRTKGSHDDSQALSTAEGSTIAPQEVMNLPAPKGMTTFEAALALLSAIVGGGIVGVPFSLLHCGIPLGVILNIVFAVLSYVGSLLYLRSKSKS